MLCLPIHIGNIWCLPFLSYTCGEYHEFQYVSLFCNMTNGRKSIFSWHETRDRGVPTFTAAETGPSRLYKTYLWHRDDNEMLLIAAGQCRTNVSLAKFFSHISSSIIISDIWGTYLQRWHKLVIFPFIYMCTFLFTCIPMSITKQQRNNSSVLFGMTDLEGSYFLIYLLKLDVKPTLYSICHKKLFLFQFYWKQRVLKTLNGYLLKFQIENMVQFICFSCSNLPLCKK